MYRDLKHSVNRFFRDANGKIVLGQFPNLPLLGWSVFIIIANLMPSGVMSDGFARLAEMLLFVWSYLETTQGVTYFRKALGAAVLCAIIASYFY